MRLVDKHRLVNAHQLWAALGGAWKSHRYFLGRLEKFFHAKGGSILDRPRAQFRGGEAARPYVYAIGPRGRMELDRLDGTVRTGRRDIAAENQRLGLHFLEHETAVTEVALAFQLATQQQGWSFELALKDEIAVHTRLPRAIEIAFRDDVAEPLPLLPDAYIAIDAGDGLRRSYFLEIDLGTEPHIRWNLRTSSILRKVIAYWQLSFWRPLPVDGVIFVTTSAVRARRMIEKVVRRVDPKGKGAHFFQFAHLNRLRVENYESLFYEALFHSAKVGYDNRRKLFLDECPRCRQLVDPGNEPYVILNTDPPSLAFAPGSTPLPDVLPNDPEYAHVQCPGH